MIGHAKLKGNTLHFDEVGWSLVKRVARRLKKAPKQVVMAALRRAVREGRL